jgi:hypothetical protein
MNSPHSSFSRFLANVLRMLPLGTTVVRPQGTGGLSGPLKVRVFRSENHLIAFYTLDLVERCVRICSLTDASYYFNVDFKDTDTMTVPGFGMTFDEMLIHALPTFKLIQTEPLPIRLAARRQP